MKLISFYAWALVVGTVVGAGIFGIPYALAQSSFYLGILYICVLAFAVTIVHLCLAEITLRTQAKLHLVGYIKKYLGVNAGVLMTFIMVVALPSALLIYMILGGQFLANIFGGASYAWSLVFLFLAGSLILAGSRPIAKTDLVMSGFLVLMMIVVLIWAWPKICFDNLSSFNLSASFLPYGIVLFSLIGNMAILELKDLFKKEFKTKRGGIQMRQVIVLGTLVPALLYIIFSLAVVGVSGSQTSTEAIGGLRPFLGQPIVIIVSIFGFLAVFTSFMVFARALKKMLYLDYQISQKWGLVLALGLPLIAFLAGLRNFIVIIGFTGVLLSGLEVILILLAFLYARRQKKPERQPEMILKIPNWLVYFLVAIFVLGIIYQIYYFIF